MKKKKNADFQKKKLKVGKQNVKNPNLTKTDFVTKAINVPNQSIASQSSSCSAPSKSLAQQLSLLNHFSASTRNESLNSLSNIITTTPHTLHQNLPQILTETIKLSLDIDPTVRSTLHKLYKQILTTTPPTKIQPFMPIIMAYTKSSLTHISEDVRLDALKFVKVLVEVGLVGSGGDGEVVLDFYVGILSSDSSRWKREMGEGVSLTVNPSSRLNSQKSRNDVLSNLLDLIRVLYIRDSGEFWFFKNSGVDLSIDNPKTPIRIWNQPVVDVLFKSPKLYLKQVTSPQYSVTSELFKKSHEENTRMMESSISQISNIGNDTAKHMKLCDKLVPLLLDFYIETIPQITQQSGTVISNPQQRTATTQTEAVSILNTILETMCILFTAFSNRSMIESIDQEWINKWMEVVLKQVVKWFPFSSMGKVTKSYTKLNLHCCNLVARFMYIVNPMMDGEDESNDGLEKWCGIVQDFVLNMLDQTGQEELNLKATLFPTVWILIERVEEEERTVILDKLIKLFTSSPTNSQTKKDTFLFLQRIILTLSSRKYKTNRKVTIPTSFLEKFVMLLPRWIYELNQSDVELTLSVIKFLRCCYKESLLGLDILNTQDALIKNMIPIFHVHLKQKGNLFGPFKLYQPNLQIELLDFTYYVLNVRNDVGEKFVKSIALCCFLDQIDGSVLSRFYQLISLLAPKFSECIIPLTVEFGMVGYNLTNLKLHEGDGSAAMQIFKIEDSKGKKRKRDDEGDEEEGLYELWCKKKDTAKIVEDHVRSETSEIREQFCVEIKRILENYELPIASSYNLLRVLSTVDDSEETKRLIAKTHEEYVSVSKNRELTDGENRILQEILAKS